MFTCTGAAAPARRWRASGEVVGVSSPERCEGPAGGAPRGRAARTLRRGPASTSGGAMSAPPPPPPPRATRPTSCSFDVDDVDEDVCAGEDPRSPVARDFKVGGSPSREKALSFDVDDDRGPPLQRRYARLAELGRGGEEPPPPPPREPPPPRDGRATVDLYRVSSRPARFGAGRRRTFDARSTSIGPMFGRVAFSRRGLDARPKRPVRTVRRRARRSRVADAEPAQVAAGRAVAVARRARRAQPRAVAARDAAAAAGGPARAADRAGEGRRRPRVRGRGRGRRPGVPPVAAAVAAGVVSGGF